MSPALYVQLTVHVLLLSPWSSNMAKITGTCMIIMGCCGFVWYQEYQSKKAFDLYVAIYNL